MDRRELAIIWTSHPISGRSEAATVRIPPLPPPPPVCGHLLHLSLVLVPNCGFLRRSRVHPASIPSAHRPAGHCLLRLSCDGLCHGLSQQRHDSAHLAALAVPPAAHSIPRPLAAAGIAAGGGDGGEGGWREEDRSLPRGDGISDSDLVADSRANLIGWIVRLNLALFYLNGRYPTLAHRVAGQNDRKRPGGQLQQRGRRRWAGREHIPRPH